MCVELLEELQFRQRVVGNNFRKRNGLMRENVMMLLSSTFPSHGVQSKL